MTLEMEGFSYSKLLREELKYMSGQGQGGATCLSPLGLVIELQLAAVCVIY